MLRRPEALLTRPFELPQRSDLTAMLKLAVPVVVAQVGMMLMGVVDTMVVGRVSAEALAAVALGNLAIMVVSGFVYGLLMALDPLVAQAFGARDEVGARRAVQRGLLLAVLVTVPATAVLLPVEPLLQLARQPADVIPIAVGYIYRCLPGLLPFYAFVVLRHTLQALERIRPIVITIALANVLNLILDLALVFGKMGLPAMGAFGSAWATSASRAALLAGLVVVAWRDLRPVTLPLEREAFRMRPLWRTVLLGAPIGIQLQLELGAFGVIALLMGTLGTVSMAAHQVAINLASLTFMVPLGISTAAAVRVGHAVGRQDGSGARRAASAALLCGAGFMALTAVLFIGLPLALATLYTSDGAVTALAAALIPIAGVFQVFDGLQVVSSGILRGIGDTRVPMVINVLGFWLVGLPVSVALGFGAGLGPRGLWWGLVFALAALAALLMLRVARQLSRPVDRVLVE
jgi:MATE family multidrug resistance protein